MQKYCICHYDVNVVIAICWPYDKFIMLFHICRTVVSGTLINQQSSSLLGKWLLRTIHDSLRFLDEVLLLIYPVANIFILFLDQDIGGGFFLQVYFFKHDSILCR